MKWLSRQEVRRLIKKGLELNLTLSEIKKSIRHIEIRTMEEKTGRYGW